MNELHRAYNVLGLEPGASLEVVLRRYKRLIMVWHPDRFPNGEGKREAEEELKKINNAKDKLKAHFEGGSHRTGGTCECAGQQGHSSRSGQSAYGPGPWQRKKTTTEQEEEAARKRNQQRQQSEADEAWRQAQEQAKAATADQQQEAFQQAVQEQQERQDDKIRWQISIACAATFIVLLVVALAAGGVESATIGAQDALGGTHESAEETLQHSEDWSHYIDDRQQVASRLLDRPVSTDEILDWHPPYSSPNGSSIARQIYDKLNPPAPPMAQQEPLWDPLYGPITGPSGPGLPNIDIHPALSADELTERISTYQAKLQELQRQLNEQRAAGTLTADQDSDLNRQMNALRQQIDIDQTALKSAQSGLPQTNNGTQELPISPEPGETRFFNSPPADSSPSKLPLGEQLEQALDRYKSRHPSGE